MYSGRLTRTGKIHAVEDLTDRYPICGAGKCSTIGTKRFSSGLKSRVRIVDEPVTCKRCKELVKTVSQ